MRLFSLNETSYILGANTTALNELVKLGKIPYKKIGDSLRFCPNELRKWAATNQDFDVDDKKYIERYKQELRSKNPGLFKKIKSFSSKYSEPHETKGYYLEAVPNKKLGIVYYVKYLKDGQLVPSKWTTRTNDRAAAERYAVENKDKLLKTYFEKKAEKKPHINLYTVLKKYYASNSPYLRTDRNRGRTLVESTRTAYNSFANNVFIPYLRKNKISNFEQITTPFLILFQDYLLVDSFKKDGSISHKGIKAQTVNIYMSALNTIFQHLLARGHINTNPFKNLPALIATNVKDTGCYEIDRLKGVWNKRWENELSFMLTIIISSTNMRNSEIERIKLHDFFMIDNYHFLNIPDSKSKNGIRKVPVHDFVYKKIIAYAKKNNKNELDNIFKLGKRKKLGGVVYENAFKELGKHAGYTEEQLKQENITFYSSRHFWKTLMAANGLGDIEEYFMGHRTSNDVGKNYNHKDKIGKKKLLEKVDKLFSILDEYIFEKR